MWDFIMSKAEIWMYVLGAVAIAVLGNYTSAVWASKDDKFSLLLLAVIVISPFVFITFGLVTSKVGVAVGSGTIDALLTISTVMVGLIVFGEWNKLSIYQYLGLICVLTGVILLQISVKPEA